MDLEQLSRQNDDFRGTVMDTEKGKRLAYMRTIAEQITAANPRVICNYSPAVNVRRHAGVRLLLPLPLFNTSAEFIQKLGELISSAEAVAFARVPEEKSEKLLITCDVLNIWKED